MQNINLFFHGNDTLNNLNKFRECLKVRGRFNPVQIDSTKSTKNCFYFSICIKYRKTFHFQSNAYAFHLEAFW